MRISDCSSDVCSSDLSYNPAGCGRTAWIQDWFIRGQLFPVAFTERLALEHRPRPCRASGIRDDDTDFPLVLGVGKIFPGCRRLYAGSRVVRNDKPPRCFRPKIL